MAEIEYTLMVLCPQENKLIEVGNECIGCEHYDGKDEYNQCITCSFGE